VARSRSPERDEAQKLYLDSKGEMKLIDIASKLNLPEGTIRGWKNKDKWDDKLTGTFQTKGTERSVKKLTPKKERSQIKKLELDETELTEKQKLFCLYYIKNFNAAQAVIKAGYDVKDSQRAAEIGYQLLHLPPVRKEIDRLKEMKRQSIMLTEDDILERYMRIAFADMTDFVEFGRETVPVMTMFGPMEVKNPETGLVEKVTKEVNTMKFKESVMVDGGLICQIKQGKDGSSLKLEDRQKALDWLANYFNMNPMDKHKQEYDKHKLEIENQKLEIDKKIAERKIQVDSTIADAITNSNEKIKTLAEMMNNPLPDRKIEDFEDD